MSTDTSNMCVGKSSLYVSVFQVIYFNLQTLNRISMSYIIHTICVFPFMS